MTHTDTDFPVSIRQNFRRASLAILGTVAAVTAWAAFAPITSTLQIPGSVNTVQPVVDLQSLEGGRIAEVLVRPLGEVAKGQLILRFDVSSATENRRATSRQIAMLEAELYGTETMRLRNLPTTTPADDVETVLIEVANRHESYRADRNRLMAEIDASRSRSETLLQEIATQAVLVSIAENRAVRMRSLVAQGLRPDSDLADAEERLAAATLALQSRKSEKLDADNRTAATQNAVAAHQAEFAVTIAAIRRKDSERLIELRLKLTELDALIRHSEIRAPVSGTVVNLPFDTPGDIARPGDVLAQISAPVEGVEIKLRIPVRYIDQVIPGKRGTILIPALPQRQMPRVEITVTAVASSAELDRDGNPAGYAALALIDPDDLEPVLRALGPDHNIARDMPVVVMLEGRATTPLGYFVEPLRKATQLAFEEG